MSSGRAQRRTGLGSGPSLREFPYPLTSNIPYRFNESDSDIYANYILSRRDPPTNTGLAATGAEGPSLRSSVEVNRRDGPVQPQFIRGPLPIIP